MSTTCIGPQCDRTEIYCRGLCHSHYAQDRRNDGHLTPLRARRGTGWLDPKTGYRYVSNRTHANREASGRIAEHRLVMSNHLGRALASHEHVHHINGVRDDNRLENLEIWVTHHPPGQRIPDLVAFAKEVLQTYDPASLRRPSGVD